MPGFPGFGLPLRPLPPRVRRKRVPAIRREILHELAALLVREARADADVLERAGIVEKAEQQRADRGALASPVPAKAGHHAVAIALVLHLEHHALVGLVGAGDRLGHHAVETRSLEAAKPIRGDARVGGGGRQMNGRRRGGEQQFQLLAARLKRFAAQVPVPLAQQVEQDDGRRSFPRQKVDPRCGGVQA